MARVFKDIDRGFKRLVARFREFKIGPNVTVGVQGSEASLSRGVGLTNAGLAAVHEFGSKDGRIPQRSFIRSTADREKAKIERLLTRSVKLAVVGKSMRQQLGEVGATVTADMKRTIDQSIDIVANAPSTIAKKGSATPLIDTGILKNSITWKTHKV